MSGPVVFISYSHDSDEHREKVLRLAERLRQDGLDARLDQYVNGTPDQGWPRWILDQLDEAAFVLVACTETYYRRFRGREEPGRGKGADWEGALITQKIYDARSRTVKFVPVTLTGGQERFIPEPLRPHTYYELISEERYQTLYRFLLGQAGVKPRRLGKTRWLSKQTAQPLTFGPASASPPPTAARPTMIGVPHHNPFFTGREDLLARLHQRLQTQGISALAQAAIHGLGGIGKTETAIEYAHRFGGHYRFVLWVIAEEETAIRAAYLSIARELMLVDRQTNFETAVLAVKAWLSREDSWLLVFDNADDPSLLRSYLPSARVGGKILLTSRAKSFTMVGIREPFRVETLEPEDAVKFLIERTGNADTQAAADLAAELGYLPLALEQAAAYIETVGGGFAEYLAKYRRQGVALLAKGKPSTDYPKTIATTWTLSFAAVREASPASAELLTAAAFLVPDSVPIEIFTLGGSKLGAVLSQELKGAAEDPLAFWELLEPLERYSLVERLPDDAFKLHRLTQEVVKDSLNEEGCRAWAGRVVRALSAAHPRTEFANWKLCARLQPNAWPALGLARTYKLYSYDTGVLFNMTGRFASILGDYADAKLFEELALEIFVRVLGDKHPATLRAKNSVAITLGDLGDLAGAKVLHEKILQTRECLMGSEHPDTLNSRNNLASTLYRLGDHSGAKMLEEQNLGTCERLFGLEHPNTLTARNNLAETLRFLGDLVRAKMLTEQNLQMRERLLGSEHPDTLNSRNNLAGILDALGDLAGAKKLLEQNLGIHERLLEGEHADAWMTRNNLGTILCDIGDLAGARKLLEQDLESRERLLGSEHPDITAATWNLLHIIHQLKDRNAEAQLIDKLRWLLDRDENSISSVRQRNVRQWLLDFLKPS